MIFFTSYIRLLKTRAVVRFLTFFFLFVSGAAIYFFATQQTNKKPVITEIDPPVGMPEEMLTITGENFGDARDNSYVDIANSRITGSRYVEWSDRLIKIRLPANVQDGLVTVNTTLGRSEPIFFANKSNIPVPVRSDPKTTFPSIQSVTPASAATGQTVTITGSNFGAVRGAAKVYFSANREGDSPQFIAASAGDYDYEYWSDSEIHVRVPDGAAEGLLYVSTERGESQQLPFSVNFATGKKNYASLRTYSLRTIANLQNNSLDTTQEILLYMPRPAVSSMQPEATLGEISPEPLILDDPNNIIFQGRIPPAEGTLHNFSVTSVVKVYAITANIIPRQIAAYSDKSRLLYKTYTSAEQGIPSAESQIMELAASITGKTRNPYDKAKSIYNYMVDNYKIRSMVRTGNVAPLDLLERKTGDAFDFAIIYTALCRAANIPALPMCGIFVEGQDSVRDHWWTEIYFENYGWFPVDCALGAGLEYKFFAPSDDPRSFYFGNMDNQHIAFSRGRTQIRTSLSSNRVVQRPRSYALQSCWEETNLSDANYSSLWSAPAIIGIY